PIPRSVVAAAPKRRARLHMGERRRRDRFRLVECGSDRRRPLLLHVEFYEGLVSRHTLTRGPRSRRRATCLPLTPRGRGAPSALLTAQRATSRRSTPLGASLPTVRRQRGTPAL